LILTSYSDDRFADCSPPIASTSLEPSPQETAAGATAGSTLTTTLIGHWPLKTDSRDYSSSNLISVSKALQFGQSNGTKTGQRGARFDGQSSVIAIENAHSLQLGNKEFTISLWARTDGAASDSPGDLISCYDPSKRTGFNLGIYSHGGVTNSQPNSRQLHFGIDQARLEAGFTDHGRLGDSVFVFALCVHNNHLYASTCQAGATQAGHVFRFEGGDRWTDLGSPDNANAISAMTVYQGNLYVASAKYRLAGSSLSESENPNFGGKVYRLTQGDTWESCGTVSAETEAIASLVVFRDQLYASSLYRPAGFFRYGGGQQWTACATPNGKRTEALTVYNDSIFATCYDEGAVFRFDGEQWHDAGVIPEATQTYGFGVYRGNLYVSEWPKAHVFRYLGDSLWIDAGKLGQELEAMPLLVYNGKMYSGSLPSAEVFRFDDNLSWSSIGRVDMTPDVKYRRAWSMAVYRGRMFVGTLPSGRVLSIEAGKNATLDREFPTGWHHIAAVRNSSSLQLYLDGELVSESSTFQATEFDLTDAKSLQIGFGAQDHFLGEMADIRMYRGALSANQIKRLSETKEE
jgi:hypothetical protein